MLDFWMLVFWIRGRISCKPKKGALLSSSTHKNDDSTGAGMDILASLLAVIIVTFIIQLLTSVTMIARMVLIIII